MASSVETANIDEVLSSIRRLVRDDFSQKTVERGSEDTEGRLVLTPALRIAGGDDEWEASQSFDAAEVIDPLPEEQQVVASQWEGVSLADRISRLEAAAATAGGEWSPEEPLQQPLAEAQPEAGDSYLQLTSPIMPPEEAAAELDMELLQTLVSETIRQELKGEMGDRISRNLRKMVRREIARALAERDMT